MRTPYGPGGRPGDEPVLQPGGEIGADPFGMSGSSATLLFTCDFADDGDDGDDGPAEDWTASGASEVDFVVSTSCSTALTGDVVAPEDYGE